MHPAVMEERKDPEALNTPQSPPYSSLADHPLFHMLRMSGREVWVTLVSLLPSLGTPTPTLPRCQEAETVILGLQEDF